MDKILRILGFKSIKSAVLLNCFITVSYIDNGFFSFVVVITFFIASVRNIFYCYPSNCKWIFDCSWNKALLEYLQHNQRQWSFPPIPDRGKCSLPFSKKYGCNLLLDSILAKAVPKDEKEGFKNIISYISAYWLFDIYYKYSLYRVKTPRMGKKVPINKKIILIFLARFFDQFEGFLRLWFYYFPPMPKSLIYDPF